MARDHILTVVLMEDRPDALAHLVSLLHRRAFRVDSLACGASERPGVIRLTLGTQVEPAEADRLARELRRSMHVLAVDCLAGHPGVERELLLVKVTAAADRRAEILQLAEVFRANVVDLAPESVSLELTGDRDKLDALLRILEPFGVLEAARTGPVAMGRGTDALAARDQSTSWLDRQEVKRRLDQPPEPHVVAASARPELDRASSDSPFSENTLSETTLPETTLQSNAPSPQE